MGKKIIIDRAVVIKGAQDETLNPGYVLIEDDRIKKVQSEPFEDNLRIQADEIIDAKNGYLLPGLINTHTHAGMSLFRSFADDMALMDWLENKIWPAEAKLTGERVYWGTLLSIVEMLKSGTTTFADMYFYMDDVAKAVEESGIRASLSRGMIGLKGDDSLHEAKDFINNWHHQADGRITCMVAPHAPYTCPPNFLGKAISLSEELSVPIHIHVSETEGEVKESQKEYGYSPVVHLLKVGLFERPTLAAHCVHVNEEDISILAERNVAVSHNIGSNLKLGSGISPINKMLSKGVIVSLGTDGASSNNNLDLLEEARISSLVQKGVHHDPTMIKAKTALKMATINGAKSLGLQSIGRVEPGYKADLIIINKDSAELYPRHNAIANIIYSCSSQNVNTAIINGEIIMKNKELIKLDEEKIFHEADKNAKILVN